MGLKIMPINVVLKNWNEIGEAYYAIERAGLRLTQDLVKCWDIMKAFKFITEHKNADSIILDVGTYKCSILEMLNRVGCHNLYGCDLSPIEWKRLIYPHLRQGRFIQAFKSLIGKGPIRLSRQDLHNTKYPSIFFDFITSLSVIEHGVDMECYFKEMSRILRIGGYLITSADYWHEKINTEGIQEYGVEWKVLNRNDVEGAIQLAKNFGLELIEPIDYTYERPIIEWKNRKFTFIFFILRKIDRGG